MNQKDAEILGKIMEIARLKKEIVQAIVPEKTYKHLEVIGNEFKALVIDLISEAACDDREEAENNAADCKPTESSRIKKVDID